MESNTLNKDGETWRGVPFTEILGSQSPPNVPEFPVVCPSYNHAVLYHIPSSGILPTDGPPKPHISQDKWDQDHVRMPCSSHSLYPVEDINGKPRLKKRWDIIQRALSKPIRNSEELANAILSYNTKFKTIWKFPSLHMLFDEYLEEEETEIFFNVTLPEIAKLALALPKLVQAPIPLLKQQKNKSVSLSQQQISSLLANAFFCTFPRRNTMKRASEYASYPHINFSPLYETMPSDAIMEKLKCLCHYFKRVCEKVPSGTLTFSRRAASVRSAASWAAATHALPPLHCDSDATIEEAHGLIQLDFANKFVGGGVLGYGCVQEEIRFVICPELMVSMLFTEMLMPNEALMMIGCAQYSAYSGYGRSFRWAGPAAPAPRAAVLALDALPHRSRAGELRESAILRDLNKAWVGFSFYAEEEAEAEPRALRYPGVATGNWGCGAFGGSAPLKALLQLLAAAAAARALAYCSYGDRRLRDRLLRVHALLAASRVTAGQLYNYIIKFSRTPMRRQRTCMSTSRGLSSRSTAALIKITRKARFRHVKFFDDSGKNSQTDLLSSSLEKEFLNDSPDLFSQDEADHSSDFKTNQMDVSVRDPEPSTSDYKMAPTGNKMAATEHEMAATEHEMAASSSSRKSRLFDEMEKFDESNGRLNLTDTNTRPFKQTANVNQTTSDMETSMDYDDKIQLELSVEVKKKISKKITDYFSKKSI
ncbi:poly(ADP-ribose) glycohydrolase [Aphomia sociella]